jgi:outer membrane cobalamin receptor
VTAQALLAAAVLALLSVPVAAQERATVPELPPVEVIGVAPLPAFGVPLQKYHGNVQSTTSEAMEEQDALDVSDILYRRFGSVTISSTQGNPWQNDLTYRGFLASPLTGSPIGLSVYLDGLRFNDSFGETVSWDLIPRRAIAEVDVIPGSNPIFGLNTIGGALAVHTKTGREFGGTMLGAAGGSFGRWNVEAEHGGIRGPLDWYLAFNAMNEDGWRERSPSELRQLYANAGWEARGTRLSVSYIYANNELVGNGLVPEGTLARDRSAVHTFPDETRNRMHLGHSAADTS